MVPENWHVIQRGTDTLGSWVWIDRYQERRTTSWKLYQMKGEWRITKIVFSRENQGLNRVLEREKSYFGQCRCHPKGIRLSANRIDRILKDMAEGRYEER